MEHWRRWSGNLHHYLSIIPPLVLSSLSFSLFSTLQLLLYLSDSILLPTFSLDSSWEVMGVQGSKICHKDLSEMWTIQSNYITLTIWYLPSLVCQKAFGYWWNAVMVMEHQALLNLLANDSTIYLLSCVILCFQSLSLSRSLSFFHLAITLKWLSYRLPLMSTVWLGKVCKCVNAGSCWNIYWSLFLSISLCTFHLSLLPARDGGKNSTTNHHIEFSVPCHSTAQILNRTWWNIPIGI